MSLDQIAVIFIAAAVMGYLLGSLNGAQFIHHIWRSTFPRHITRVGTKIAGTQNVWMRIGRSPALFVLAIDIAKGYVAVSVLNALGMELPFAFVGGVAAVAGHNWPIFFHFRGGRGVATLVGTLFALDFRLALIIVLLAQFFTLIRWSGIMPFGLIAGFAYTGYQSWGMILVLLMAAAAAIIFAKRLQAYWSFFAKNDKKLWVLKNIVWYDRPEDNPPSLREVFKIW